jgi:hypothetical protein
MDIANVQKVTSGICLSQILLTKRQQKNTWTIFLQKLRPHKKRNQQSGPLLRYILRV